MRISARNDNVLLLVIVLTAVASVATGLYVYDTASIYDVIEYPMEVYVDNIAGFNVDANSIHFGIIPPGSSGGREVTVTAGGYRTRVTFESTGDITPWISVSDNDFFLSPYENRTVTVSVSIPDDVVPLAYRKGTMRIVFRHA